MHNKNSFYLAYFDCEYKFNNIVDKKKINFFIIDDLPDRIENNSGVFENYCDDITESNRYCHYFYNVINTYHMMDYKMLNWYHQFNKNKWKIVPILDQVYKHVNSDVSEDTIGTVGFKICFEKKTDYIRYKLISE